MTHTEFAYTFEPKTPNKPRDLSAAWEKPIPLADASPRVRELIDHFCESKNITREALEQLETRVKVDKSGGVVLAYPRRVLTPEGEVVCAVRYRPLDPDRPRYCEKGSALAPPVLPQVIGDTTSLEWYVVEGETDAARLWMLTEGKAAILILGGTQGSRAAEWDLLYPPEASVYIALDSDSRKPDDLPGTLRGEEAAAIMLDRLGDRAVRLRPPGKDWCEPIFVEAP
jgi:hypothetical protein